MIVKIIDKDKTYVSPVFAYSNYKHTKIVVFNETFSELIVLRCFDFRASYKVVFLDFNCENFAIQSEKLKSYWDDEDIINVVKKKRYTKEQFDEAVELLKSTEYSETLTINNENDIEAFLHNVWHFHDACVMEMKEANDDCTIQMDTFNGGFLLMHCTGVIANDLEIGDGLYEAKVEIDSDNSVTIVFGENLILKAKNIQYKIVAGINYSTRNFDFSFDGDTLTIVHDKRQSKINLADLREKAKEFMIEENVIGFLDREDESRRLSIFDGERMLHFHGYDIYYGGKRDKKLAEKYRELEEELKMRNFFLNDEVLARIGDYTLNTERLGALIHRQSYGKLHECLRETYMAIGGAVLVGAFFMLVIHPNKIKYTDAAIAAAITLAVEMIFLCIKWKKAASESFLEIYEGGIYCHKNGCSFRLEYDSIIVEYEKRIIIRFDNQKIKLYKSKNDAFIYETIKNKIEECKQAN